MGLKQQLCQTSAAALCTCIHLWLPSCFLQQARCGIGDLCVLTNDLEKSNLTPSSILSLLFEVMLLFCVGFFGLLVWFFSGHFRVVYS